MRNYQVQASLLPVIMSIRDQTSGFLRLFFHPLGSFLLQYHKIRVQESHWLLISSFLNLTSLKSQIACLLFRQTDCRPLSMLREPISKKRGYTKIQVIQRSVT
jgi:hypothetical protein